MSMQRIIDANLNRLCEGIRVIEDIVRFIIENESIYKKLKTIRHEIRQNTARFEFEKYRDSENDVGKISFLSNELKRDNLEDIITANFKRIEESLRVLEEIFKIENVNLSEFFKKIRFEIYSIEKIIFSKKIRFSNLLKRGKPILYGIIDTRFSKFDHIKIAKDLIEGGIKIIQMREKALNDKEKLKIAKEISKLCNDNNVIFIVNDRVDIAHLTEADGLHLGQDDLPVNEAKKIFGFDKIYGLSTHNFKQVEEAVKIKPDYIGFGPIFPTKSKENPDPVVGINSLKKIYESFQKLPPVVAIGGINKTNIKDVICCNPEMICVMSGIIGSNDIKNEIKKYMELIDDTVRSC